MKLFFLLMALPKRQICLPYWQAGAALHSISKPITITSDLLHCIHEHHSWATELGTRKSVFGGGDAQKTSRTHRSMVEFVVLFILTCAADGK